MFQYTNIVTRCLRHPAGKAREMEKMTVETIFSLHEEPMTCEYFFLARWRRVEQRSESQLRTSC